MSEAFVMTAPRGAAGTGESGQWDEADSIALREQVEHGESEVATLRQVLWTTQQNCVRAQAEMMEAQSQEQTAAKEAQASQHVVAELKDVQREVAAANAELARKSRSHLEMQRYGKASAQQLQRELKRRNEEINQLTADREGLMFNLRKVVEDRARLKQRAELLASGHQERASEALGDPAEGFAVTGPRSTGRAAADREAEELRVATSELKSAREAALEAQRRAREEAAEVCAAEAAVLAEAKGDLEAEKQRREAVELRCCEELGAMESRAEERRRSAEEADLAAQAALHELDELQKVKLQSDNRAQTLEKQAAACLRAERRAKEQAERWHKEWVAMTERIEAAEKECQALEGERAVLYRFTVMMVVFALAIVALVVKVAAAVP